MWLHEHVQGGHLKDCDLHRYDCPNFVLCGCIVFFAKGHDVDTLQTFVHKHNMQTTSHAVSKVRLACVKRQGNVGDAKQMLQETAVSC